MFLPKSKYSIVRVQALIKQTPQNIKNIFKIHAKQIKQFHNRNDHYDYLIGSLAKFDASANDIGKPLTGVVFAVKDNLWTLKQKTTAGSKFLKNFTSGQNAFVVQQLLNAGGQLIAKTNLDEFAMGASGTTSAFGCPKNPWDLERITGGSSSGSAGLVGIDGCIFALGSDTGDSVRLPASYCGVIGFKPSWGVISRDGLIDFAPSLDTIGILARNIDDVKTVFEISRAWNVNDFSQVKLPDLQSSVLHQPCKIGIPRIIYQTLDPKVKILFDQVLSIYRQQGYQCEEFDFPIDQLQAVGLTYDIISYAEASTCLANLTNLTFGKHTIKYKTWEELYTRIRSQKIGPMVQKRLILGAYFLIEKTASSKLQVAKKARYEIAKTANEIFLKYPIILAPTTEGIAPKISAIQNSLATQTWFYKYCSSFTTWANLIGAPSISVPMGFLQGLPIGVNITAAPLHDQHCLSVAKTYADLNNLADLAAKTI